MSGKGLRTVTWLVSIASFHGEASLPSQFVPQQTDMPKWEPSKNSVGIGATQYSSLGMGNLWSVGLAWPSEIVRVAIEHV